MTRSFENLRQRAQVEWKASQDDGKPRILVGTATCGRSAGAIEVLEALQRESRNRGLDCPVVEVGCIGLCYAEPIVAIFKPSRPGIVYGNVNAPRAARLIERYLLRDDPLAAEALGTLGPESVEGIPRLQDTPVMRHQVRRILRNCGFIDPAKIDHYLAHGGYSGFTKALALDTAEIIEEIKKAGLRGRGGAGFPAWRKWQFTREAKGAKKYVVCNGSEGDPGTFSNKLLLESDPHSVLEGMLIAALAMGADEGYVYCPAQYSLALERLRTALLQMREYGLLGEGILGSSFNFRIEIKEGAGAYICGEETALLECIEGKRGVPRLRPPFPPTAGLWNLPTAIHNVETLACAAAILQNGAPWFAELGTAKSKGTKLFCLSGSVQRGGVIEVPFGTTLHEMIYAIGGGAADGEELKAVQTGGPGGGYLPPGLWDTPVDQDSLLAFGSSTGSGGVVAVDRRSCAVDLARNSLDFARRECCGQCVPCRLGTRQLFDILVDIAEGRGRPQDMELLVELSEGIKRGSLCGLGQTAPNALLSTIRYFPDEYRAHIGQRRCPAGVCRMANSSQLSRTA
ncbi:MAG: SLBB domain-containing protein [Pirellulales bacterium]|nr:SLBB domain-containing protein [Pirellulales bacterium]